MKKEYCFQFLTGGLEILWLIHNIHNSIFPFALRPWMPNLLKILLFLLRVGVVEAHDELAFKCDLVVLVEQSSLGMANMKVSNHRKTEKKKITLLRRDQTPSTQLGI